MLLLCTTMGYSQAPAQWSLGGNANVDTACFLGSSNPAPLRFKTSAQERMVILPSGEVGIGTVSPSKDLTVAGSVQLQSLSGFGSRAVLTDSAGNLFPAPLKPQPGGNDPNYCGQMLWTGSGNFPQSDCYLGTNNQEDLRFATSATEKMVLTVDGKLGLGS